jgi:methylmalonyl-CoA mutase N-terminal domain/subunit
VYHNRGTGSTAVQELTFTLANGITYVQAGISACLDVDQFARQISFFFNAHNNFLEEIAKFRAARRLWAKIMRHRFEAQDPKSWRLRFHAQTAGSTLTAQQPENNVIRVALQALAAVFGGTQSLHTNSRDEALALPSEESVQIALRTQQIIAYESGTGDTVDPLAGSYYLEFLTNELEARATEYIDAIDEMGGMLPAIESGYVQREVHEAAYQFHRAVEEGREIVVGVNEFVQEGKGQTIEMMKLDPAVETAQRERLAALRERRDGAKVAELRGQLAAAAQTDENLMPLFITCVENDLTLGEICHTLRDVWGEYHPSVEL